MTRSPLVPLALAAAALAVGPAAAQAPVPDRHAAAPVTAVRAASAVRIDGRLDDAAWAAATPLTRFTQVDPEEGAPGSEETEARFLYDDEALYVGVRLRDRGAVRARLGRRDMPLGDSDWVGLVLDSYHDHRTAYSFDLNPAGVRRDALKTDDGDDNSWDAVWQGASSVDAEGWSAEYRIPFSQLRFNPGEEQTWGVLVERVIGRRNEYAVSAFTPRRERGGIATYGHLLGLRGVRTGKRLEILPYTVAKAEHVAPGANPFRTDREYGVSAGVDLKYRVTSDLTLDATLNPDFGQVEVDPARVNLGAVETFFEEKRPFFVEGSEIFSFAGGSLPTGGGLFYTRRIGRAPQLRPATERADVPTAARILGAAKLSGKTRGGWSVGVMEALTDRETSRYLGPGGERLRVEVEPLTNYLVGRVRRDLREGATSVGGVATAVNRLGMEDGARALLTTSGYTAGVDFRHEWAGRAWQANGYVVGSRIAGSSAALLGEQLFAPSRYFGRPDADHLAVDSAATSLAGYVAGIAVGKQAGEHWRFDASATTISPGFEANDLGFQYRGDRMDLSGGLAYLQRKPGSFWRSWHVEGDARGEWNRGGQHIYNSFFLGSGFRHLSYWGGNLSFGATLPSLDDRLTRGGPLARRPANARVSLGLYTDSRRALTGRASVYHQRDDEGGSNLSVDAGMGLKTSPRWNLSIGPYFERGVTRAQYVGSQADAAAVATYGRRYVFTPLRQTTVALETRFNYTFDPRLSLEVYAQPYVASADFGESHALAEPRTLDFEPYAGTLRRDDFTYLSLRGNAVLRWEYRTGSTLYVAWQQNREGDHDRGGFRLDRDPRALFDSHADNVFVVKMTYWLNP